MDEKEINSVEYDNNSIDGFEYEDRIRKRPAVMLGSSGLDGTKQTVMEIVGNSLDEVSTGFGDRMIICKYSDGAISVRDFGRGVPLGWNENKGMYNWHLVYNELYMGGKTKSTQDQLRKVRDWSKFNPQSINYLFAVGLNGLGATSTQYSSRYFIVKSYKDGECIEMHYADGQPIVNGQKCRVDKSFDWSLYKENKYPTDEPDGTFVKWLPDDRVFTNINVTFEYLCSIAQTISSTAHIKMELHDEETGKDVVYEASDETEQLRRLCKGHDDEIDQIFTGHKLVHGIRKVSGEDFIFVDDINVFLTLISSGGSCKFNHNLVKISGGSHDAGVAAGMSRFLTNIANQANAKVTARDYDGTFSCVVSTKSNDSTTLRGQTKDSILDIDIEDGISDIIYSTLSKEYAKGNEYIKRYVDMIIDKANQRIAIANQMKLTKEMSKMTKAKKPEKYSTCEAYEKKLPGAELWLAEGDSAKGAIISVRDSFWQAALPLRGKCLNCAKASIEDILDNTEIKNIFALLETGMDLGGGISTFDISKLRFDKVIFATDADEDGFQIRVLLFIIFFVLAPDMLKPCGVDEKGRTVSHVYIAETPRFGIKLRNGEMVYANTDEVRDELYSKYSGQVVGTERYKGLGETSKEVLRVTTVAKETRNLIPIVIDFNDQDSIDLIDILFGRDKYKMRKQVLAQVLGSDVLDMIDDIEMKLETINNNDEDDGVNYEDITIAN